MVIIRIMLLKSQVLGVAAQQEHVAAGLHGAHAGARSAVVVVNGVHAEGVGLDDAVEAEFFAQVTVDNRARHGGGRARGVHRGDNGVADHDGVGAGGEEFARGAVVERLEFVERLADFGDALVGVHGGRTVAGEMFYHHGQAGALVAAHHGERVARDERGVLAEGGGLDRGAARELKHVGAGRLDEVDAEGAHLEAGETRGFLGERGIVGAAEGHVAAEDERAIAVEVVACAALLVDADEDRQAAALLKRERLEFVEQRGVFLRRKVGAGIADEAALVVVVGVRAIAHERDAALGHDGPEIIQQGAGLQNRAAKLSDFFGERKRENVFFGNGAGGNRVHKNARPAKPHAVGTCNRPGTFHD